MPQQSKLFVFDFDGTLADSFHLVIEAYNKYASKLFLKPVSIEEIPSLRKLSTQELVMHFRIGPLRLPLLVFLIRRHIRKNISNVPPFEGLSNFLLKLSESGALLAVLTSSERKSVEAFWDRHKLPPLSAGRYNVGYFKKASALDSLIKECGFDGERKNVMLIGDEVRDIDAAHKCSTLSTAVTWGFANKEALAKAKPFYLVESILEMQKEFL